MADYPTLAATLAALNSVKTTPTDSEDASKLAAVDRQTRLWLYDFLGTIVDSSTGKLKATAFGAASITAESIRGATANSGGDARELLTGSVSTPDLRDDAVTTDKIADANVTTAKIADLNVTTAKIADANVTTVKIADLNVTGAKLANGAVTAAKIGTGEVGTTQLAAAAVTSAKIATNGVDGVNLPTGTAGQLLLHNGTKYVSTSISGGITIDGSGVATLSITGSSTSSARVSERTSAGTSCGATSAASWAQKRGVTTGWVIDNALGTSFVAVGASGALNLSLDGVYLVTCRVPAYSVGRHKVKMTFHPVSGGDTDYISDASVAQAGVTSHCFISCIITVTGATVGTPATLTLYHWTQIAEAAGLGLATNATEVERYASLELLRIN